MTQLSNQAVNSCLLTGVPAAGGEALKSAAARWKLRANAGVLDRSLKASIQTPQIAQATSQRKVPLKGKATFSGTVSHLSDLL